MNEILPRSAAKRLTFRIYRMICILKYVQDAEIFNDFKVLGMQGETCMEG